MKKSQHAPWCPAHLLEGALEAREVFILEPHGASVVCAAPQLHLGLQAWGQGQQP